MQFSDVLLRLIPFTSSKDGETVFFSNMQGGDWIITVFILMLWCIFGYLFLNRKFKKDKKILTQLTSDLKSIDQNSNHSELIELISDKTRDTDAWYAWNDFKKNLIQSNDQGQISYYRIYDSKAFFNQQSLLGYIGKSLFNSGSSFLLSIGLLGTFFGLFYGLIQLNLDNADTLQDSMRILINASGAKFSSSIWGLGLATLYSFLEKGILNRTSKAIADIQFILNDRFPLLIAEQLHQSSLDVQNISKETQYSILDVNKRILQIQQDSYGILNTLSYDIGMAVGSQISSTIIEGMKGAMQELVDNVGGSKEDTLHHALTELKSGVGGDFSQKLEKVLSNFMDEIKKSTGSDVENLQTQIESISGLVSTLTTQISTQTTKLDNFIKLLDGKIQTITDNTQASKDAISEAAVNAGQTVANAAKPIVHIVGDFKEFADKLSSIKEQVESFERSTLSLKTASANTVESTNKFDTSIGTLNSASSTMRSAVKSFGTNLDKLQELPTKLNEITIKAGEISNESEKTYKDLATAFGDLTEVNQQSVNSLKKDLAAYQQTTEGFIKQILDEAKAETTGVLDAMSAGVTAYKGSSDAHIASNLEAQRKEMEKYIEKANELLKTTISNYDKQLEVFVNGLSSATAELSESMEMLSSKLNRGK
ncbi:anti-phage defense ZorAB system protein ZorA [Moraxella sp. FZFQ2102]|uniref:anti-phage ZorAB system protein ZorA n=1 Tax=Moraxella sp. FZFQ2102 TaxID=2953752 RepID=UPI00209C48BE|nr:anti-phage ZorAB system protein ZorA [Moraxella sp. FZFQ2102]USZ15602.1 anti-phage defense ZorAB system protein ZorA [Moraxella sp. FZFQ2102]